MKVAPTNESSTQLDIPHLDQNIKQTPTPASPDPPQLFHKNTFSPKNAEGLKVPMGIGSDEENLGNGDDKLLSKTLKSGRSHRQSAIDKIASAVSNIFYSANAESTAVEGGSEMPWYIILPNSPSRLYWQSMLNLLSLTEVLWYQTFRFVFSQEVDNMFVANEVINLLFLFSWFTNFFEAVLESDGTVNTDLRKIFRHNITSRYTYISLFSCFPYELIKTLDTGTGFEPRSFGAFVNMVLNLGKLLRFFRNVEKHSKVKALTAFDVWLNRSQYATAAIRVSKVLLLFIHTAHLWGCILVLAFDDFTVNDPRESWLGSQDVIDADAVHTYFTALYFSVTTLTTIGYGDIVPIGFWERNVWILMGLSGAIMYAGIFGTVTATLQKLEQKYSGLEDELQMIGTFCKLYDIPLDSEMKLLTYRKHQWNATQGLQIENVLSDLPFELVTEIKVCLYKDDILKISYFTDCGDTFIRAIVPFIKPSVCMSGDFIVRKGDPASEMYCLKHGNAQVLLKIDTDLADDRMAELEEMEVVNKIKTGEMFGNIGLLLKSNHRTASVRAHSFCELWSINREAFNFVMPDFPGILKRIIAHALHCLDRDVKTKTLTPEGKALVRKNIKELEKQMKFIADKLHRRRVSCLSNNRGKRGSARESTISTGSRYSTHFGGKKKKVERKGSRSSLSNMASFLMGGANSGVRKMFLGSRKSSAQMFRTSGVDHTSRDKESLVKKTSHVDLVGEMRRRAERRVSELDKRKDKESHSPSPTSLRNGRPGSVTAFRPRKMTQQLVQTLSGNIGCDGDDIQRRGSLVAKVVNSGGSLEQRSMRNSQTAVNSRFGPPGLTGGFLGSPSTSQHVDVLLERMKSLENKFDRLILAVTSTEHDNRRLGTVTSVGGMRHSNVEGGFPDLSTGDFSLGDGDSQSKDAEDPEGFGE